MGLAGSGGHDDQGSSLFYLWGSWWAAALDYNQAFGWLPGTFMLVARRYIVRGKVQGVGFRFFTDDTARLAGVHGHVSNRDDGSVEVMAEGDLDAVTRLEAGLRQGPPGARVDTVEVEERVPAGVATGFSIETGDAWI
tara:strand:+ start:2248 stop:2661 length:414 start_codon:yes stop_codon:yes gene_type:complete